MIGEHPVTLDPRRALWWPEQRTLFLADTHFGKDATARKLGLPVPRGVTESDLDRMKSLITDYSPAHIWILGDVFDSAAATECLTMELLQRSFSSWKEIQITMIPGNHDRRIQPLAATLGISVHAAPYLVGPWRLMHAPDPAPIGDGYVLSGHLHPGVRITGAGRQSLRLPAFIIGERHTILPAFSEFTGLAIHRWPTSARLFAIGSNRVYSLKSEQCQNSRANK